MGDRVRVRVRSRVFMAGFLSVVFCHKHYREDNAVFSNNGVDFFVLDWDKDGT
jgi:hypothetical protein